MSFEAFKRAAAQVGAGMLGSHEVVSFRTVRNWPLLLVVEEPYSEVVARWRDKAFAFFVAGLALLAFGSGPIKGFAVVHCLGILTSMFSAVFFSRGLVNLWYGRHKKIQKLAIGQVWRPQEK